MSTTSNCVSFVASPFAARANQTVPRLAPITNNGSEAHVKGVPPAEVKAEIMAGRSISLCFPKHRILSSAIVTGVLPIALGTALAAARDLAKDSHGNAYVPILMGEPGKKELPQRGQWAFCHAVYPGQIFSKDDPLVASTMAAWPTHSIVRMTASLRTIKHDVRNCVSQLWSI